MPPRELPNRAKAQNEQGPQNNHVLRSRWLWDVSADKRRTPMRNASRECKRQTLEPVRNSHPAEGIHHAHNQ
eukprot:12951059-Alexandrium_andersonii.AAC.1